MAKDFLSFSGLLLGPPSPVLESPKTINLLTPSLIPNFIACNPVYASAVNGSAMLEWVTACDVRISLFSFRAIILEADLNPKRS
ncbi:hypothetical protein Gotur_000910 [Gossypium turneri]